MSAAQPGQGVELMLYGMGTVLLFLVLLVYAMRLMSAVLARWFPEPVAAPPSPRTGDATARAGDAALVDPQLLAAIGAAVHAHRRRTHAIRSPTPRQEPS
jgi:oxaloacetate decarboxylase gamma subunit